MLQIYDSAKKIKSKIEKKQIDMYVCGITVYDHCHIGHARIFLVFDMVVRYLKSRGYDVNYVRNITDIDDKIIKKSIEGNISSMDVADKYIKSMREDEDALNILQPTQTPRATEYIPQMISFIEKLIEDGHAYIGTNNDVFYSISSFKDYGKLSGKKIDELQVGARVEEDSAKRDPLDFVLWKQAKENEPSWESPWGNGRPGWHIECSVMSLNCLGKTFDIHGGGFDLMFPHHENECAQSVAHNKTEFVKNWMHVGYLQVNKEKMSKSLNNFLTIKEILSEYHPEVLRYLMLNSHYRSPVEYSDENILKASSSLERLYTSLRNVKVLPAKEDTSYEKEFNQAMDDDFNTPKAMSVLFELAKEINKKKANNEEVGELAGLLIKLSNALGLLYVNVEDFFKVESINEAHVEQLIKDRNDARKNKDFKKADEIRDTLDKEGILLEDTVDGTIWRKK